MKVKTCLCIDGKIFILPWKNSESFFKKCTIWNKCSIRYNCIISDVLHLKKNTLKRIKNTQQNTTIAIPILQVIERTPKHEDIWLPSVLMFFLFCIIGKNKTFPCCHNMRPQKKAANERVSECDISYPWRQKSSPQKKMSQSMGMLWSAGNEYLHSS
jgi:hypothetical protein